MKNNKRMKSFAVLSAAFISTILSSVTVGAAPSTQVNDASNTKSYVIAQVNSYLNVRNSPSLEGKVIGKLYNNGVGTMITDGEWIKIQSGSVQGYVSSKYVLTGDKAKKLADQVGDKYGIVKATTLRVREKADITSKILDLVDEGKRVDIVGSQGDWTKVRYDGKEGFVSTQYIKQYVEYQYAESKEEEASQSQSSNTKPASTSQSQSASQSQSSSQSQPTSTKPVENSQNTTISKVSGEAVVTYAKQFLGNPYVYGGTSLTNGTDCSGFVQSIYKKFGVSLPRTSSQQSKAGKSVNGIKNAQLGDLFYYSGHIGIYIGDGKIISASNARDGIKLSNATYKPILAIRRVI